MSEIVLQKEKVREIFSSLSVDKRRLPSSGLTKLGIPSYVGEWILDEITPGEGELSPEELEEILAFTDLMLPKKNEQGVYKHRLLTGEVVQLLAYMSVEIDITRTKRTREAKIPALGFKDCWISDDLVERHHDLLKKALKPTL